MAVAALAMRPVGLDLMLREVCIVLLGIVLGVTVTPATLALLPRWPITLAFLVAAMVSIMASGAWYLERVHGFDRATSRLSAMPGALAFVMALAIESSADQRRVAIVQVVRISAILLLLPSLVTLTGGTLSNRVFQPAGDVVKLLQLPFVLLAGFGGAFLFKRLGTPAPQLFGAMVATALLYGPGLADTAMPQPVVMGVFLVLGALIGSNFAGADIRLFMATATAGLGSLAVSGLVALAFALPAAAIVGLPAIQVWLAFAPGGVETSALLALALGLDAAFVSSHHIMRVIVLNSLVGWWVAPFTESARATWPDSSKCIQVIGPAGGDLFTLAVACEIETLLTGDTETARPKPISRAWRRHAPSPACRASAVPSDASQAEADFVAHPQPVGPIRSR